MLTNQFFTEFALPLDKIKFDSDGTAMIQTFMTKNGKPKDGVTYNQATDYIKKLIEEKKNAGKLGKYLFCSKKDINKPLPKNNFNR